jgi:formylglycine-generating enzyme required for sulfatase activity
VRSAIIKILEENPPPRESLAFDAYQLDLVVQRSLLARDWKLLDKLMRTTEAWPQNRVIQDYTLLRGLKPERISRQDFVLPERLRKLFYSTDRVPLSRDDLLVSGISLVLFLLAISAVLFFPSKPKQTFSFNMELMPGGQFLMGDQKGYNDERPPHNVSLSPFYIGKYEVTQAEWMDVEKLPRVKIDFVSNPSKFKGDNLPVESVSWEEAVEFCARLSVATGLQYRLPTEAEWEYACRAGTTTDFAFGNDLSMEQANFDGTYMSVPQGNYLGHTAMVSSYSPNAWNLYNMHGNVWEWCQDWYDGNYEVQGLDVNPSGANSGTTRVVRGGGWNGDARSLRSAFRGGATPAARFDHVGFRLARDYP